MTAPTLSGKDKNKPWQIYDDDAVESVRVALHEEAAPYGANGTEHQHMVDYSAPRAVAVDAICASEPLVTTALEQLEQLDMRLGRIINRCTALSAQRYAGPAFRGDQSVVRLARDVITALWAREQARQ